MARRFSALPKWAQAFREERDNPAGLPPLRFLDEEASQAQSVAMLDAWQGVPFDEGFHASCRARIARSTPIATLPPRKVRLADASEEATLLFDPERDDSLFVSLGHTMPSILWVPLGQTRESAADALSAYLVDDPRSVHVLRRAERVFKGTADQLGLRTLDDLGRAIARFEPWIDAPFWSSALDDDPWPMDTASLSMIELRGLLDGCREQAPNRFESRSFRTLWSRSVLRVEKHPFDAFVLELRYEPARHPDVIRELQAYFPFRLADDVPVDLVASILRGPTVTRGFLAEMLAKEEPSPYLALAACAIAPGETTTLEVLRRLYAKGGDEGDVAVELAGPYQFQGFLLETLATTKNPALRADLEAFLAPGSLDVDDGEDEDEIDQEDEA